jgi:hypothetical protein
VLGCLLFTACTSPLRAEAFIYWGDSVANTIQRSNLNGTGVDSGFITDVVQGPRGLAVDGAHIYWGNRNENTIGRANLDGSGVDQQFITGADDPNGVAVDAAHVYWVNTDTDTIGRADLDGSDPDQDFVSVTGSNSTDVAVDAEHIYWADAGGGAIGRANLNGSLSDPDFIEADSASGVAVNASHIYWASFTTFPPATAGAIGRANLDGSVPDLDFIPDPNALNPTAVALDDTHVYWTNTGLPNTIGRANLDGSGVNRDFITGMSFLAGLEVDPLSVPSCRSASASTGHAESVSLTLSCTSGGGRRTFSIASQPARGEISGLDPSTGEVTYTPEPGFFGTVSFRFRASNPGATSPAATSTIDVAPASNVFEIGDAKRNRKKGTAELMVEVPGPGELILEQSSKVRGASESAPAAGEVGLLVKPRGKSRKKLKKKGKAKVSADVTFAPVGGEPNTQSARLKLVKK